jgi:predicted dinucleotide-binding enzyme
MKIGLIGAGALGTALGKRLAAKGHAIMVSFARTPESLAAAIQAIGGGSRGSAPEEAAADSELIVLATPWAVTLEVVAQLSPALAGKIVWDATNPLKPDMSGLVLGTTTSAGEEVAKAAPKARVVKAIPPFAEVLHDASTEVAGVRPGVFVCGDDPSARQIVLRLLDDLGAAGVEAGPLQLARYTEPLGMLLVQLAYSQGFGARIGVHLLREAAAAARVR